MAITIEDIKKLRAMTGAGLADVKKALTEAEGDFDKAKELLRERGLAIAAKRSDRETSNGCVLVKKVEGFAAMVAVKCETDFVANGADFIAMTQTILDAAVAAKCQNLDEVKELDINGQKAQDVVTQRSGITAPLPVTMLRFTTTWVSTSSAPWFSSTRRTSTPVTSSPCRWQL